MKKMLAFLLFLILLAGGTVLYARYIEPAMLHTKYIEIPGGPKLRIALFSDTHFGADYAQENIERIVNKINGQNPDVVVFVGDFYDNYSRDRELLDTEYMKAQLLKIKGEKFAVWGNHDYGGGAQFIYQSLMEESGFRLLANESVYLEAYGLTVTGYDELLFGSRDPAFLDLSTGTYNLLLAHEADIALNIVSDTPGLMLGGHSHGGQVAVPFLEPYLPEGSKTFYKGLYPADETDGNNRVFVTSGIGTSIYPFRFLNVPEVVILDLGGNS